MFTFKSILQSQSGLAAADRGDTESSAAESGTHFKYGTRVWEQVADDKLWAAKS